MKKVKVTKQLKDVSITTIFCDKCGHEVKDKNAYDAFECEMTLRIGSYDAYESGFYGDKWEIDLCEPCAKFVFETILPTNNIKINHLDD